MNLFIFIFIIFFVYTEIENERKALKNEMKQKEDEMRQMFVQKVKEKEAVLRESEEQVSILFYMYLNEILIFEILNVNIY